MAIPKKYRRTRLSTPAAIMLQQTGKIAAGANQDLTISLTPADTSTPEMDVLEITMRVDGSADSSGDGTLRFLLNSVQVGSDYTATLSGGYNNYALAVRINPAVNNTCVARSVSASLSIKNFSTEATLIRTKVV